MIDGVLLLDKPSDLSSGLAMRQARRLLAADKAGHGGTLDPAADGLLVILLGEATAFARYLLGGDKTYEARMTFGWRSETDDGEGRLTRVAPPPANLGAALAAALPSFVGDIWQTAPAYSALKLDGKRLRDYARRGIATPAKRRLVTTRELTLRGAEGESASLLARCGSGFYVRALARDLGETLGCGAYLSALRRARSSHFDVADAISLARLREMPLAERLRAVRPVADIVAALPALTLAEEEARALGAGKILPAPGAAEGDGHRRVFITGDRFAGVVDCVAGSLRPLRLLRWTREQR